MTYRRCYECGRTLSPTEPSTEVEITVSTSPADDLTNETIETQRVLLCEMDAAIDKARNAGDYGR